jgi:hypothetical protein
MTSLDFGESKVITLLDKSHPGADSGNKGEWQQSRRVPMVSWESCIMRGNLKMPIYCAF